MRIGINLLYLIPDIVGGTEIYASGLLCGLAKINQQDEFIIYVNQEAKAWPLPDTPNVTRIVCPVSAMNPSKRYLFEQLQFPRLLKKHRIDLLHSLGYVSPLFIPCPLLVTIHDLNYRAFGNEMPLSRRLALTFFVKASAHRAHCVVTVSEFSRREILKAFNLPDDRVVVTHEAPRIWSEQKIYPNPQINLFKEFDITHPYMVAFSSHSPNKNIFRLLHAFMQAKNQYRLPHQLVLIGHKPRDISATDDSAIRFIDYLQEDTLHAVLLKAQMLVFPSIYEGFGLPVLEAMDIGIPVVCSNKASLPEVSGEAAIFFDPFSINDMAQKIGQIALDSALQDVLRKKGFENVKRFSWDKTACETLKAYRKVFVS